MNTPYNANFQEILVSAARLVVEDGFEYGPAKQQAIRQLGLPARTPLPDNAALEDAVREHIALFYADTQPKELQKLREIALEWMQLMSDFSPYLSGSVWHGTATRLSDIYIQLFCDDPKMAEIHLLNHDIRYTSSDMNGLGHQLIHTLCVIKKIPEWQQQVLTYMNVHDANDIRGALKMDTKNRPPRGNITAVQRLLDQQGNE